MYMYFEKIKKREYADIVVILCPLKLYVIQESSRHSDRIRLGQTFMIVVGSSMVLSTWGLCITEMLKQSEKAGAKNYRRLLLNDKAL